MRISDWSADVCSSDLFLDQNADRIKGATIGGVEPTYENIAVGDYGVSRSLFFYVKNAHAGVIPGIEEFATEFTSEAGRGETGYLTDMGDRKSTRLNSSH